MYNDQNNNELDDNDNNNDLNPSTRDIVITIKPQLQTGPGNQSKYQQRYNITNNNEVRDGAANNWTISYANGLYTYIASPDGNKLSFSSSEPVNLMNAANVTVQSGTTLDGVYFGTTGNIRLLAGATITNSVLQILPVSDQGQMVQKGLITVNGVINNSIITTSQGQINSGGGIYDSVLLSKGQGTIVTFTSDKNSSGMTSWGLSPYVDTPILNVLPNGSFDINSNYWGSSSIYMYNNSYNCFLASVMIETENGLIAIEDIQVGDQVVTYDNGQQKLSPVIWTGHNFAKVAANCAEDDAGYPVRIIKDAIADGIPSKDLLITSEHSILIDNQLIPVRMLVNGLTIFYDHSITEYTFYHIETEKHSIISADNMLTESYLDTGNRHCFISDDNIVHISSKHKEWDLDSAAPLVTTREIVEPIFMSFVERAKKLGMRMVSKEVTTTNDSGLYLLTDSGKVITNISKIKDSLVFKLPENTTQVRLISRTSRPSRIVGPFIDDRRDLGVLVGQINLLENNQVIAITEHFSSAELQGWADQEKTGCRWTQGDALLNIGTASSNSKRMLIIQILAEGSYIIDENELDKLKIA